MRAVRARLRARWGLVKWRWAKWLKVRRAKQYREELHFRSSKGYPVSISEWQECNELMREANEF